MVNLAFERVPDVMLEALVVSTLGTLFKLKSAFTCVSVRAAYAPATTAIRSPLFLVMLPISDRFDVSLVLDRVPDVMLEALVASTLGTFPRPTVVGDRSVISLDTWW